MRIAIVLTVLAVASICFSEPRVSTAGLNDMPWSARDAVRKAGIPDALATVQGTAINRIYLEESQKTLYRVKAFDSRSQKVVAVTVDENGNQANYDSLLTKEQTLSRLKYGKLSRALASRLSDVRKQDRPIVTTITLKDNLIANNPIPRLLTSDSGSIESWKMRNEAFIASRKRSLDTCVQSIKKQTRQIVSANNLTAPLLDSSFFLNPYTASISVTLPPDVVDKIQVISEIQALDCGADTVACELNEACAAMNDPQIRTSFPGNGVKVGLWEYTKPDPAGDYFSQLPSYVVQYSQRPPLDVWNPNDLHAAYMLGAISNRGGYNGFAQNAQLFLANCGKAEVPTTYDAANVSISWMANQKSCTVINRSWLSKADGTYDSYDAEVDRSAYNYPHPTHVQAAGDDNSETGNGVPQCTKSCYNAIIAGSVNGYLFHSVQSCFRNPNNGEELPQVMAYVNDPWEPNAYYTMTIFPNVPDGSTMRGATSLASAITTGIVAQLQNVNAMLKYWPEATRAILMASARNTDGTTNFPDFPVSANDKTNGYLYPGHNYPSVVSSIVAIGDGRCGAGMINGYDAGLCAYRYVASDNSGNLVTNLSKGWTVSPVFVSSGITGTIQVVPPSSGTMRAVLSWVSNPDAGLDDLDLMWYRNGTWGGSSYSYTNPYEVVTMPVTAGQTIALKVNVWRLYDALYYAVAWCVR